MTKHHIVFIHLKMAAMVNFFSFFMMVNFMCFYLIKNVFFKKRENMSFGHYNNRLLFITFFCNLLLIQQVQF